MGVVENTTVSGQVSSTGTPINVVFPATSTIEISNTSDSIAIGTSSTLFTGTSISGKFGLDVNLIGGNVTVTPSGTQNVNIVSSITLPISAASLPLPTGAATAALQSTGNSELTTINSTLGTPMQQTGGSLSVTNFPATQAVTQSGTWTVGLTTESIEIGKVDQGSGGTSPWLSSDADITVIGSLSALNAELDISVIGKAIVRFQISGTWVGTVSYYQTTDGTNYDPSPFVIDATQPYTNTNSITPSVSTNITGLAEVTGCTSFKLVMTGYTSGTAAITAVASAHQSLVMSAGSTIVFGEVTADQGAGEWLTNVSSFGGNTVVTGTGTSGLGIPRVTVSSDSSILAVQSGAWITGRTWVLSSASDSINVNNFPVTQAVSGSLGRTWDLSSGTDSIAVVQSGTWNIGTVSSITSPISISGTVAVTQGTTPWTVNGTVTSNAGTNLNTSALALESGGHLASIDNKVPALGQALAAASVPIVLTASQLTTLTPLTSVAVTNAGTFAVQAALNAETTKVIGTVNVASGQTIAVTNTGTFATQSTLSAETTKVIGTVNVAASQTIAVTNAGTFAVQATLAAETTKVIGTVNQGTSPWVVSGNVTNLTQGTLTDRSGTATGSSTTMMNANSARKFLLVQVTGTKGIWINFTAAATALSPSIFIAPNTTFQMEGSFVSTEAITVIRDSSPNVAFTAKEG